MRAPTTTDLSPAQRYEKERYQRRKVAKAEYIRQWRLLHPEAKQKENRLRKERMGGASRNFTAAERALLHEKQSNRCGDLRGPSGRGAHRNRVDRSISMEFLTTLFIFLN